MIGYSKITNGAWEQGNVEKYFFWVEDAIKHNRGRIWLSLSIKGNEFSKKSLGVTKLKKQSAKIKDISDFVNDYINFDPDKISDLEKGRLIRYVRNLTDRYKSKFQGHCSLRIKSYLFGQARDVDVAIKIMTELAKKYDYDEILKTDSKILEMIKQDFTENSFKEQIDFPYDEAGIESKEDEWKESDRLRSCSISSIGCFAAINQI